MNEAWLNFLMDFIGVFFLCLSLIAAAKRVFTRAQKDSAVAGAKMVLNRGDLGSLSAIEVQQLADEAGNEAENKAKSKKWWEILSEFISTSPEWILFGVFGLFLIFADSLIPNLLSRITSG